MKSVKAVLVDHLQHLYDAEKMLMKTLPKIAKAANASVLQAVLQLGLDETKNHVSRLERVFERLETPVTSKLCQGMRGLLEVSKEVMEENSSGACSDLGIIAAAQEVEHFQISAYGTARALAEQIGDEDIVSLFEATLLEEKEADAKLTEVASTVLEDLFAGDAEADEEEEVMANSPIRGMGNGQIKLRG
jgi:ferritin-like metal-binding protein YciE